MVSAHQCVSFFTKLNFYQVFGASSLPWDANNTTMQFFSPVKNCFFGSHTGDKILKTLRKVKNKISPPLPYWGFKIFALMRGFQILSQNWVRIIFDLYFGRKTTKKRWNRKSGLFFSANIGVNYYPNSILRLYLESSHQGEPFRLPIWKRV